MTRDASSIELITPRLRLRRARPDDLAALHAVLSDPRAMQYWSTPPHTEIDQTRAWLAAMIAASPDESDDFVIEREGRVIGKAGCWRAPEIGFILHPDCWGRGLAREALQAVIPRAFAVFPIDAVTADVDPRNAASLALLTRLGFEETHRASRTVKVGDDWCDSIYLALRRPRAEMSSGQ
ncbi:MAG TPA: GNAT family N-acetyltransferase [Caulobacteraceae bacterium]|jgi:RimJ/RimL family protein N-acetyltransferase|nr:GNAT family N-acetyltransferase [Caulobacteraceae bacterium]